MALSGPLSGLWSLGSSYDGSLLQWPPHSCDCIGWSMWGVGKQDLGWPTQEHLRTKTNRELRRSIRSGSQDRRMCLMLHCKLLGTMLAHEVSYTALMWTGSTHWNLCSYPAASRFPPLLPIGRGTRLAGTVESATMSTWSGKALRFSDTASAKVIAVVGADTVSPLSGTTWEDVMLHMAQRLGWIDSSFEMLVFTDEALLSGKIGQEIDTIINKSNIAVIVSVTDPEAVKFVQSRFCGKISTLVCFDSSPELETLLGGLKVRPLDPVERALGALPGSKRGEAVKVLGIVMEAWDRASSDDFRFALLVLVDSYVTPVKLLKNLRATSLASLQCMVKNCRSQILACLLNPNCRQALNCLTSCSPSDQVCSYRCIVSYESPLLEAFSLCVLQKHNCLGLTAEILMQPDVQPLAVFRGETVNHDIAEDLFVGWLGRPKLAVRGTQPGEAKEAEKMEWSWRVVAGQNAAYDQFPCQYQLFYRGKAKGSMWYDPVFQVQTLDGRMVWRRRHYRVRRGQTAGTFYFSVLDNGVISKEFWRIVEVMDDLSWGLFYYSGAAEAAGQSYTGAILVTPDGKWPAERETERLTAALDRCGIKLWELYRVNNAGCADPPLGIPEGSSLHCAIA